MGSEAVSGSQRRLMRIDTRGAIVGCWSGESEGGEKERWKKWRKPKPEGQASLGGLLSNLIEIPTELTSYLYKEL